MSQAVPTELDNLSTICLKVYNYSLVAMGAHSERLCEILTSSRRREVFGRTRITVDSVAGCAHLYCAVHLTTQCIHQLTGCVSVDGRDVTDVTDVTDVS